MVPEPFLVVLVPRSHNNSTCHSTAALGPPQLETNHVPELRRVNGGSSLPVEFLLCAASYFHGGEGLFEQLDVESAHCLLY